MGKNIILITIAASLVGVVLVWLVNVNKTVDSTDSLVAAKTLSELSMEAPLIIRGVIVEQMPSQQSSGNIFDNDSPIIYTEYLVMVKEELKSSSADEITIRQLGGSIGEGYEKMTYGYEDNAELREGEEVILFLSKGTDGYFDLPENHYTIYGSFQGKYEISDGKAIGYQETIELENLLRVIEENK